MTPAKKTSAISCYLDPNLVEAYNRIEGRKPTLSSLLDFALAAYLNEVSGQEQMYQRVLSFNVKLRRGIAAQRKEQEEADRLLEQKRTADKNKKDAVIRGYIAEAVMRVSGSIVDPVKSKRDEENNQMYVASIKGYIDYKHHINVKPITEEQIRVVYQEIKVMKE
jgi:hypothetical protein